MNKLATSILLSTALLTGFAAAEKPNILFLFADDQRPDTIAAFGNPHIQTPNLDKLAASGFSFRRNYCPGSFSGAVCVASRAMLMTGRYWMNIPHNPTFPTTFPEQLGQHGYTTHIVGKWHNGKEKLVQSFQSGTSVFMGGMADHTAVPLQDLNNGELVNKRVGSEFSSTEFANAAIDFLQVHDGEKPFLLYVAFTAPHDPRNPTEAYREYYYRNRPPLPENFLPQHPFDNAFMGGRDEGLAAWPRDPKVISDQLCEYYGLITQLDEQVGRILEQLKKTPFADNTVVVYTADHGLAMGSHGLLGKQNVYEHSMGCPLIISGPGIPANEQTREITFLTDLYPTLCSAAGVPVPDQLDGKDLSTLWTGNKQRLHSSVFLPFQKKMRAVHDGRWKLHVYPLINHRVLFDLQNDPHETTDLAAQHPEQVERLLKLMKEWQARLGDEFPLQSTDPLPRQIDMTGQPRKMDGWQPQWIRDKYFDGRTEVDHGPAQKKTTPP